MRPYEGFGRVYDAMGHDAFSIRMAEYTLRVLKRFRVEPRHGLDLCCGTGSAIRVFSGRGIRMTGLDRSEQMLANARRKLAGLGVRLHRMTLPRFTIRSATARRPSPLRRFDLVTCFFDSLNYLRDERQLRSAFRSVRRHLQPGGWFVFDMNTPRQLRTVFTGQRVFAGVNADTAWIFRNGRTRAVNSADLLLTFFVRRGNGWRRFDEVHRERAYPIGVISRALRSAGMQVVARYECFTFRTATSDALRVCFLARRPASRARRGSAGTPGHRSRAAGSPGRRS